MRAPARHDGRSDGGVPDTARDRMPDLGRRRDHLRETGGTTRPVVRRHLVIAAAVAASPAREPASSRTAAKAGEGAASAEKFRLTRNRLIPPARETARRRGLGSIADPRRRSRGLEGARYWRNESRAGDEYCLTNGVFLCAADETRDAARNAKNRPGRIVARSSARRNNRVSNLHRI